VRTCDKKARGIILPTEINGSELRDLISTKVSIPLESLVLYNKGEEIK
jgi:hypothetical protein